jgi:hypothetical protein
MEKKFGHWIVNEAGIEWDNEKPGSYSFGGGRLLELGPGSEGKYYEWLLHIPQKTWVTKSDVYSLNEAFLYAAELYDFPIDKEIYDATIKLQAKEISDK